MLLGKLGLEQVDLSGHDDLESLDYLLLMVADSHENDFVLLEVDLCRAFDGCSSLKSIMIQYVESLVKLVDFEKNGKTTDVNCIRIISSE